MIKFHVNKDPKATHIYKQIYKNLKKFILEHKIASGDKLPSKRRLADELHVSINSVETAYEQLLAEGYIYSIQRKGYFVENIAQFVKNTAHNDPLPHNMKEEFAQKDGWLSLSHIQTDCTMFPFHAWIKSEEMAITHYKSELSEIPHPQGPYTTRKTIADMIALSRGVICEPEQIVIGTGIHSLLRQLMNTQSTTSKIAMENPGYSRVYRILKDMDFDVIPTPLDKDGFNLHEAKQTDPTFLFVTPSHQLPTGTIMPISRRVDLLNWAAESDNRYIIEDDYDSEFKYETDNIPSLQGLDQNNRVIYFGTFSKTLLPSFRISYMVLPPDLLALFKNYYAEFIHGCSSLLLYTLHFFIKSGEYAKHIKRMNQQYEMKRQHLIKELHATFQDKIHIHDIPAGLHFLASFNSPRTYEEIAQQAKAEKLELYTMKHFMLDDMSIDSENIFLVIGFANITFDEIPEVVERLRRIML
ncbi:MAG TPA: PLP-dependent aminotransferase family protein [Bacillota bacterium]|nr:PLP-dependent aminotransferase family protein [Bacillota bacterium]